MVVRFVHERLGQPSPVNVRRAGGGPARRQVVTAPSEALETEAAYFAITPRL